MLLSSPTNPPTILVVVGNPKPASRTRSVGEAVARQISDGARERWDLDAVVEVLEVSEIAPNLLAWGDPVATRAVENLLGADLIVVASPVFKATYTGLLKLLFDQIGAGQLDGKPAVPLMVGAGPHHALAVEAHLRPLLVEVGASCPSQGLYILESQLHALDQILDGWGATAVPLLLGVLAARTAEGAVAS